MTGPARADAFEDRFRRHVRDAEMFAGAAVVIVAVSGGLDSMTLLHLLRFCGILPRSAELHAAHFDHRIRADSGEDASWVVAVCEDWDVKAHSARAPAPVRTEAEGRELRYRFFEEARLALGVPAAVATAHTADDQAETVLFRIARGSGPAGLAGVLPRRGLGIVRPLLPFWRSEIRDFAQRRGVPFREDPSNRDLRWTRNRLRRSVLPLLEKAVPGATAALASHADASLLQSRALDELLDERIAGLATSPGDSAELCLDRDALAALSEPVLALVLRRAAARVGAVLGRRATAALARFVRRAQSGRRLALPGGARAEHRLGRIVLRPPSALRPPVAAPPPSQPALRASPAARPRVLVASKPGQGAYTWAGRRVAVAWGPARLGGFPHVARFCTTDLSFPLVVRPWAPGDRVAMPYGKKKVKKLLLEARIPKCDRLGLPVLALPGGPVLWVPGVTAVRPARNVQGRKTAPSSLWHVHVRSSVVPPPGTSS